jgi:hypothetical protein
MQWGTMIKDKSPKWKQLYKDGVSSELQILFVQQKNFVEETMNSKSVSWKKK